MSYLWKTEGEVSLEGLRNLVVLANEVAGLWLEKVDGRAANVGTGVDTVEVVLLVVLAVLELEAADVKPPKSVLGVSWNPVVEVGTVGLTVGISRVISRFCGICKSTRGLSGPNWEVTANAGGSVGVSCCVSCCVSCWVKTGENRLAPWATGTGGACGKAAAWAVNKFWLFVRNWLKRAKLEADVDGGGPAKKEVKDILYRFLTKFLVSVLLVYVSLQYKVISTISFDEENDDFTVCCQKTWKKTPNLHHFGFASKIITTLKNLKFNESECREIVVCLINLDQIEKVYIYFQTYQIVFKVPQSLKLFCCIRTGHVFYWDLFVNQSSKFILMEKKSSIKNLRKSTIFLSNCHA